MNISYSGGTGIKLRLIIRISRQLLCSFHWYCMSGSLNNGKFAQTSNKTFDIKICCLESRVNNIREPFCRVLGVVPVTRTLFWTQFLKMTLQRWLSLVTKTASVRSDQSAHPTDVNLPLCFHFMMCCQFWKKRMLSDLSLNNCTQRNPKCMKYVNLLSLFNLSLIGYLGNKCECATSPQPYGGYFEPIIVQHDEVIVWTNQKQEQCWNCVTEYITQFHSIPTPPICKITKWKEYLEAWVNHN